MNAGPAHRNEEIIMSTDTTDPQANGQVISLRAAEVPTEVQLADTHPAAPAYVDVSDGTAARKPVIPAHLREGDGPAGLYRGVRRHLHHRAIEHGHAAAYHGIRSPRYITLTVAWAVVGLFRISGRIISWWHATDLYQLEHQAAADGLLTDHLRIHKQGRESRTARGIILAACAVLLAVAVLLVDKFAPSWAWILLGLVAVPVLARHGRPAGKPIVQSAVLPAAVQAPSQDVITRALGSLGMASLDRWIRDGHPLVFPSPVREDGPGWRAEVDLPFGCTASQVIERREQLASGLRRPLGAVWPEPVTHEHAGRLELWVGRADIAVAKPPPWPLLRSGQCDIFQPVPLGTDVRGRSVKVPLIYNNWLVGAIPRQGKTASVRVLTCAAALDPLCELWVHELKGSGDLDPLERVSHRFVSGIDDESIGRAAESLRLLRAEVGRRAERLRALPRELCPDKRVTREIAARRSLKLWPVVCVIDEVQNLFTHPQHAKAAGQDAEFVIKSGPAFGIVLILATQRPDKASLPTGVSGNVSCRLCFKVMGQTENDMVLGTSAYKNGIRATTFRPGTDAGIGYLSAAAMPQVVRCSYLDMHAAERVAVRARQLREAAGTLSGAALGLPDDAARNLLADLAAVFAGDTGMQWPEAAARLAQRFPDRYADLAAEALSADARALGVPSVDVKAGGRALKGCRAANVTARLAAP
jgi:DNA segregation ATPase FtsK/SpoIIIE, S-DNA-T family